MYIDSVECSFVLSVSASKPTVLGLFLIVFVEVLTSTCCGDIQGACPKLHIGICVCVRAYLCAPFQAFIPLHNPRSLATSAYHEHSCASRRAEYLACRSDSPPLVSGCYVFKGHRCSHRVVHHMSFLALLGSVHWHMVAN